MEGRAGWILMGFVLAACSCGGVRREGKAAVSLGTERVKLGAEIELGIRNVPAGWTGQVSVNNAAYLPLDAAHRSLRVTSRNGFVAGSGNDLFVLLLDRQGREIPQEHPGVLRLTVISSSVTLLPESETLSGEGGAGSIRLTAPDGFAWSASNVPDWVQVVSGLAGSGSGRIEYQARPNSTGQDRSAAIRIGDAVFELTETAGVVSNPTSAPVPEVSADAARTAARPVAEAGVSPAMVRPGGQLEIRIGRAPANFTANLSVGNLREFSFQSNLYRLRVSPENGFNSEGPVDLYLLLVDSKGRDIPVTNAGRFRVHVAPPKVQLDAEERHWNGQGASGSIKVAAADGYHWSVGGAPGWVRIESGQSGSGNGAVRYTVLENRTNLDREADLTIGDASYHILQSRASEIQIPFADSFDYATPPPPVWALTPAVESPTRWIWDEQPGQHSIVRIAPEAPSGGHSLLIDRPQADTRSWAMQVYLTGLHLQKGARYLLSAWIKAENPGPVSIVFGQNAPPYRACGPPAVLHPTSTWAKYETRLEVKGSGCESNNRLSFQAGQLRGKTWIANFSLAAAP